MLDERTLDDEDRAILSQRVAKWVDISDGPRVGDYCMMPDGTQRRFAHDWGKEHGIQVTSRFADGSFYFTEEGYMDYSGGLDPCIPHAKLVDTFTQLLAPVWFFHHNKRRAHNGVHADVVVRVYRYHP
jgi:hypothetical protein